MFMLHKRRARKPLAVSRTANIGFHPNGVGGLEGRDPVVSIQVGDYTLFVHKDVFDGLTKDIAKLADD
jgi:hypothetical protein